MIDHGRRHSVKGTRSHGTRALLFRSFHAMTSLWIWILLIAMDIANQHAPLRLRRVKSEYSPWMNNEIKKLSHHRDYLKKKAVRLKSSYYFEAYKQCKNQLNRCIKETKKLYYSSKLATSTNSKESWRTINELLNRQSKATTINEVNVNGKSIAGDKDIANEFNKHFSEIGKKLAKEIPHNDIDHLSYVTPVSNSFTFKNISKEELSYGISSMKTSKSAGIDKILIRLMQGAGSTILESLHYIFNLSLNTGVFPNDWKIARVTPIYKSEDKTDCGNYRPISIISNVAKVFEKVIYNQLLAFLNENKVLAENQSGFRLNHSTETTLLHLTNSWLANMDKGLINGVVFLDLKKAFDTVDHTILLSKLERCGVRGTPLRWFQSYLFQRKQVCKINNTVSNETDICCGVPQGSNLGPLLFLVYINDLPNCLQTTEGSMFADDTNLSCKGQTSADVEYKLNNDLKNIRKWLISNKLTLNRKKTEYMLIGSKHRLDAISESPKILYGEYQLKRVKEKYVLGLIIDDQLKWNKHNVEHCKTISKSIALLRKAKNYVSQEVLVTMYNSLVLPHFSYCSTIWHDHNNTQNIENLLKLQKRAARIITSSDYSIRSHQIFETLQWQPIKTILDKRELLLMFKIIKGKAPNYLTMLFSNCNNINYQLRSNNLKISLPKPKTDFLKKSFAYRGAASWNKLPSDILREIDECQSSYSFRILLNKLFHS